jgi:hypothetical protein
VRYTPLANRKILEASDGDALLAFVTVTHPRTLDVIRLVLDGYKYTIPDVGVFEASWFEINLLDDTEKPPRLQFKFPNVNRQAISLLRDVYTPPRVELCLTTAEYFVQDPADPKGRVPVAGFVWSNQPPDGSLMYRARSLFLTDTSASGQAVEGTCRSWDYRQEEWPSLRAKQSLLPGTYAR